MSNNEQQLNSNSACIRFTSDYEYVLGATLGRSLEISGMFHSANFLTSEIDQIAYDLEDTAKMFADQQGLSPGSPGAYGEPITGNLYENIKGVRTGQTAHLRSTAKDKYGRYYGGHVEFGHQSVPARPHLRPALYAVSQASQGKLKSALYNLLKGGFDGNMPSVFGMNKGQGASYYRGGPGQISKFMTTGTRGQRLRYSFGKQTRAQNRFKNSFSSTAKKTMGWKKQKSLSLTQRRMYNRSNSRRNLRTRSRNYSNKLKKVGYSGKGLRNAKSRMWRRYSINKSRTNLSTKDQKRVKAAQYRFNRASQGRQKVMQSQQQKSKSTFNREQRAFLNKQYNQYYSQNQALASHTGHHSNSYIQNKNIESSQKAKEQRANEKTARQLREIFDRVNGR